MSLSKKIGAVLTAAALTTPALAEVRPAPASLRADAVSLSSGQRASTPAAREKSALRGTPLFALFGVAAVVVVVVLVSSGGGNSPR